jgi:hypothetical protein
MVFTVMAVPPATAVPVAAAPVLFGSLMAAALMAATLEVDVPVAASPWLLHTT